MTRQKPKATLQWQGNLLETSPMSETIEATKVVLKGEKSSSLKSSINRTGSAAMIQGGRVKLRKETKGRSGHPVLCLYDFAQSQNWDTLCQALKTKLGCGGTWEDSQVVIQTVDVKRLKDVLKTLGFETVGL